MDDNLGNVALKNLNFRKHRMGSARKPVGRAIIYWGATIMTTEWVIANRTEKGLVDEAVFFLCYIDEEKYFMLALYLDGADSAFGVLRCVDAATHGTAEPHMELTVYANTLRHLFMDGHATKFGFTRYALQNVARRRVFFVKGVPRSFGGPDVLSTSTIQRCMDRMIPWASLSLATIPSECPEFDVR